MLPYFTKADLSEIGQQPGGNIDIGEADWGGEGWKQDVFGVLVLGSG